jgi:hypothetical protein
MRRKQSADDLAFKARFDEGREVGRHEAEYERRYADAPQLSSWVVSMAALIGIFGWAALAQSGLI